MEFLRFWLIQFSLVLAGLTILFPPRTAWDFIGNVVSAAIGAAVGTLATSLIPHRTNPLRRKDRP